MKRIFALFFVLCVGFSLAQQPYKKAELRKKSRQLTAQIQKLNKTLNETRSGSKKSLLYIKNLDEKINAQKQLVRISVKERKVLEDEIYLSQLKINKLKRELGELKKEYKDVLVNSYKNKGLQNKVLFVLSSKSFTEAFRRIKYLEKYSGFQGEKADEIEIKKRSIEKTIASRENAIREKENVLAKQEVLKENLEREKQEQNTILAEFRKNEGEIRNKIAAKSKENQKLEAEIEKIIAEEIRIAREKAEEARIERERLAKIEAEKEKARLAKLEADRLEREKEARDAAIAAGEPIPEPEPEPIPEPEPETIKVETPATPEATLASNFVASKGSLPWPVANGHVVGEFGRKPNAYLPSIYEDHAGVLIAANKGTNARAVYNGKVAQVMQIPGGKTAILLSHGSYFTVYYNLDTVFVSKGDKVTTKQELGKIYTDTDNNTILDFQVWKGMTKQNPAGWITGM